MAKVRYEFDPHNRLIASSRTLQGVRRVLEGQFRVGAHNTLTYLIKSPVPDKIKSPNQLQLKGNWSLTPDHQLRLTLDKWQRQTFGDALTIQGEVISARNNALLFAATTRSKGGPSAYILELVGRWQADERNRLTFRVDKEHGRSDSLIFDGAWQIDKNYQITYRYREEKLKRKIRKIHTIGFKGYWDIRNKYRLSYIMDKDTASRFDFKTGLGVFKEDYIKYELGIGLSHKKLPVKRTITFFGSWKLKRTIGLIFEVKRQERKIGEIIFGAEVKLTDKQSALFKLTNGMNKEIGVELELSRDIFKGEGQVFLRLLESRQESAILAGVGWQW
jgi:hypothetical protein